MAPARPADDAQWAQVIADAYGLPWTTLRSPGMVARAVRAPGPFGGRQWVTAPFLTDGGVTLNEGADLGAARAACARWIEETGDDAVVLRLRGARTWPTGDTSTFIEEGLAALVLSLAGGAEHVWRRLRGKTRNQVRKARRSGLSVAIGGEALCPQAHDVLTRAWRDLGTPSHALSFHRAIFAAFGERARAVVVSRGGAPVAAAIVIVCGGTVHHPYAAALRSAAPVCANHLLYASIIEWACAQGLDRFDMGRSRVGQGTWRFKLGWGAEPEWLQYVHVLRPGVGARLGLGRGVALASQVWRRLPLALTRTLGPQLIRCVP